MRHHFSVQLLTSASPPPFDERRTAGGKQRLDERRTGGGKQRLDERKTGGEKQNGGVPTTRLSPD
jgi:hypothetical protein